MFAMATMATIAKIFGHDMPIPLKWERAVMDKMIRKGAALHELVPPDDETTCPECEGVNHSHRASCSRVSRKRAQDGPPCPYCWSVNGIHSPDCRLH